MRNGCLLHCTLRCWLLVAHLWGCFQSALFLNFKEAFKITSAAARARVARGRCARSKKILKKSGESGSGDFFYLGACAPSAGV